MIRNKHDLEPPWKRRFRVDTIVSARIAVREPSRGLVVSNPTGVYQLHAWDVLTGRLIELTHEPNGRLFALLAPDGRHVYSFVDQEGSERGHYVRLPWDGGAEIDLTPELPPYTSLDLTLAGDSPRGCFSYVDADGYHVYRLDQLDTDVPVVRHLTTRDRPITRPTLSADGAYPLARYRPRWPESAGGAGDPLPGADAGLERQMDRAGVNGGCLSAHPHRGRMERAPRACAGPWCPGSRPECVDDSRRLAH